MSLKVWVAAILVLLWLTACTLDRSRPIRSTRSESLSTSPQVSSLLGEPLLARPPGADTAKLRLDLDIARRELAADPTNPEKVVWVGRRLGYLWRVKEAIDVYTRGIAEHPGFAPLYRHRGHRYVTLRRFKDAIADLERAAELIQGRPDEIELDGMPNDRGIPLTTLGFNVWYHLGLARYLTQDFAGALSAFGKAQDLGRGYDDNLVATTDWMYMSLCRLGRDSEAAALIKPIRVEMKIIENESYHRRVLLYKGLLAPNDLLDVVAASDLDFATLGYGLGNWHLCRGDLEQADKIFRRVIAGPYWLAFGYIAAEVELSRRPQ